MLRVLPEQGTVYWLTAAISDTRNDCRDSVEQLFDLRCPIGYDDCCDFAINYYY